MTNKDVYDDLAEMQNTEDVVGLPITPAFMKLLHLQFTPEEAALALKVRLTGGTLDELVQKTDMNKEKLEKMLHAMAEKGTMWIDPDKEDPVYRVVGSSAPGLSETGLWGGIRRPYDVELGKALHQVIHEWGRDRLSTLGFPFAPVWAAVSALPDDALPSENLAESLKDGGHWSVSLCPCRLKCPTGYPRQTLRPYSGDMSSFRRREPLDSQVRHGT